MFFNTYLIGDKFKYREDLIVLSQLKALHDELRSAVAELEAETAKPAPDEARLPAVRLKLTRVTGRRRCLIDNTICPQLHNISADDARRIDDLRRGASVLAVEASEHIVRWNMRAIAADWDGYRASSAMMRTQILKRVDDEAAIFYPLLQMCAA